MLVCMLWYLYLSKGMQLKLCVFKGFNQLHSSHVNCRCNTVDREIFVVKIFSSARGATKIKRAKH